MEIIGLTKEMALAILTALDNDQLRLKQMLDICETLSVGDASYWQTAIEVNRNAQRAIMGTRWEW